jgi:ribosomal protein S18 acetylase RimI-like enzyme
MDTSLNFAPGFSDFSVRSLQSADAAALQVLFERCDDFNRLVDGEAVSPTSGQDIFLEAPPGFSLEDKFMFGVYDRVGELVGMLEGMWGYPQAATCWIGLLLFTPDSRGQGLGRRLIAGFEDYACSHGCPEIMLGVVEENSRAYAFWQSLGFELVRTTELQHFGKKWQRVFVMRKTLISCY